VNLAKALLGGPERADAPALLGPERVTYAELQARVGAAAAVVGERVDPSDRVAIIAGNDVAFVVAYLAALHAGTVAVPLNPSAPSHELARELDAVTPALVVASPDNAGLAARTGRAEVLVLDPNDAPDAALRDPAARQHDDVAVLLFTAGTAGAPKPAMLTHGSLLANIEQMQAHPGLRISADDVALGALPMFHVFGLNVVLGLGLHVGAAVALVDHFHPTETLDRVRRDGVSVVAAVPSIYSAWLALDEQAAPSDAFAGVRLCVSGATALPSDVVDGMRERFGVVVHDGYGLTEASPVVTTTAIVAEPRRGSIGPPLPGIDVRLLDRDGNTVLEGDPGEIVVRGENVFKGYWNDAAATDAVIHDGWLHTGDIAIADADGWLTLVDRAKDVIIVSGFNVYPGEVEDALRSHPDVDEAAVVGEPHPRTGESVVAYIVLRPGASPDAVELLRHAGRRLARYKLPTRVEVVDALPRTLAGKLVRRELADRSRAPDATANPA
jgi:long-chain acyl-CoA synthetase